MPVTIPASIPTCQYGVQSSLVSLNALSGEGAFNAVTPPVLKEVGVRGNSSLECVLRYRDTASHGHQPLLWYNKQQVGLLNRLA
jgi:hypothetical protein